MAHAKPASEQNNELPERERNELVTQKLRNNDTPHGKDAPSSHALRPPLLSPFDLRHHFKDFQLTLLFDQI